MGSTFGNLIHTLDLQARVCNHRRGAVRCNQFIPQRQCPPGNLHDKRLVAVSHTDKAGSRFFNYIACAHLGLGVGLCKSLAHAHDFSGRFHFRPENRINTRKLTERKNGFLNCKSLWHDFLSEALFLERLANHAARRHLGQRGADAFGDKRHRA